MDVNWPQQLSEYGPFALLPFAFFLIERIAARRAKDLKLPEKTRQRTYAMAWVLIFVLCIAIVVFWSVDHFKTTEAMIRGRVDGLNGQQRLRGTGPETANVRVFTYQNPQEPDQIFWRTFSSAPLDDRTELTFLIDSSTRDTDDSWRYRFPANRKFYDASMDLHLRYDAPNRKLIFENSLDGKPQELSGEQIVVAEQAPSGPGWLPWFGAVFAQTKPAASAVIARLDADDPLIRLTSRKQLAALGPSASSDMDKALANVNTSYRVKLGVIVAVNQMSGFRPEGLSTPAWCEVWRSAQTGDATMKDQANLLLKRQTHPIDTASCKASQLKAYQMHTENALKVYNVQKR